MRAVRFDRFGGPEVLHVAELDDPEPGDGQVVLRLRGCALNHIDIDIRNGTSRLPISPPFTPGGEGAGEIESLGPGSVRLEELGVGPQTLSGDIVRGGSPCGTWLVCLSGSLRVCVGGWWSSAREVFASMQRKDQRRWGEVYLRGLMLDGKRKSIEPMAARLADGDEQCLQQFVNQSPWDPVGVRRALARRMSRELAAEAWVIDDTGFPKFGKRSVGVARQYSGALGKVGNCQIGVSINAAAEEASCPLNWRLFIPEEWDDESEWNQKRRKQARLPEDVHHVEKWRQALEMIDELIDWGLTPPVVLGDGAYGDTTGLRDGTGAARPRLRPTTSRAQPPPIRRGPCPSSRNGAAAADGPRRPLPPGSLMAQTAGAQHREEGRGDGHLARGAPAGR